MSELPPRSTVPDTKTAGPVAEPDPDETVRLPPASAPTEPDPDATVRLSFDTLAPGPDPDETVRIPGGASQAPEPDPDATVRLENIADSIPGVTISGPTDRLDPDETLPPSAPLVPPAVTTPPPGREKRRASPFAPKALPESIQSNLATLGGLNPLIAAANPILGAVPPIRHALRHPDPEDLRDTLLDLVEAFEASASSAGTPKETVDAAVYALCALIDESAASTPWGGEWVKSGLLYKVRGDKRGEEGFFAILDKISAAPEANADLLEFFYVCLALGFEGRYRQLGGGKAALDQVRTNLHAIVARLRARPDDGLSESWRGVTAPSAAPIAERRLPWGAAGATVLALAILFLAYDVSLGSLSGSAQQEFAKLKLHLVPARASVVTPTATAPVPAVTPAAPASVPPVTPKVPTAAATPAPQPVLAQQLAEEVRRGQIALVADAGRTSISIRVHPQFASGSVRPETQLRQIIERIAQALERVPGAIIVTAHTDALPIKSALYPSNLELSAARAQSVARLISAKLSDARRVTSKGAADAEPIAPNDTAENRAKNRRVVIDLRSAP